MALIVCGIAAIIVLGLGICAWQFQWLPIGKNKEKCESVKLPGYSFTEQDKEYFNPISDTYLIVKHSSMTNDYTIYELLSYNEHGECIQDCVRIEHKNDVTQKQYDIFKEHNVDKGTAKNLHMYKNILYFESTVKEEAILQDQAGLLEAIGNFTILENVKKGQLVELELATIEGDGYTFTDADKKYFKPVTDNYLITKIQTRSYALMSFDENNQCIQYCLRVDAGTEISPEDESKLKGTIATNDVINVVVDKGVLYLDKKLDKIIYRQDALSEAENQGYEVLVDKEKK